MSPRLERRTGAEPEHVRTIIADLPDRSGTYDTLMGQIAIDLSKLVPGGNRNIIVLEADILKGREGARTNGGRREVSLSWRGTGVEQLGPNDFLHITMQDRLRKNPDKVRKERRGRSRSGRRWVW